MFLGRLLQTEAGIRSFSIAYLGVTERRMVPVKKYPVKKYLAFCTVVLASACGSGEYEDYCQFAEGCGLPPSTTENPELVVPCL